MRWPPGLPASAFRLTRSLLKQGVGADLGNDAASEQELRRRADEIAILLRGAGVAVELDDRLGQSGRDASIYWFGRRRRCRSATPPPSSSG